MTVINKKSFRPSANAANTTLCLKHRIKLGLRHTVISLPRIGPVVRSVFWRFLSSALTFTILRITGVAFTRSSFHPLTVLGICVICPLVSTALLTLLRRPFISVCLLSRIYERFVFRIVCDPCAPFFVLFFLVFGWHIFVLGPASQAPGIVIQSRFELRP